VKCARNSALVEKRQRISWLAVLPAIAVFQICGCTVGPNYKRPAAEVPTAYKELGNWKQAQPNDQNLGGNWWEMFQDPQLNAIEAQVNVSNQNLKAAEAQYTQARALLRYNRAAYFPTITAGADASRNRISNNRPPSFATNGRTYTDYQIPLEMSYELDVWGRVRRTVESYREQAQASAADLATVNLSMHAQVALFYFQARVLDAEEQLLNSTVTEYQQALELIENRYAGGIASDLEVQQATTQLETTRAQAIDVGVARAQNEHAVAILIGKPPADFTLAALPLTTPPPPIPAGLPSELLERRPDIRQAEAQLASSNFSVEAARAAFFPQIQLTGSTGIQSAALASLFGPGAWFYTLSSGLTQPLFDGFLLESQFKQAKGVQLQNLQAYRKAVLSAFADVEKALVALAQFTLQERLQTEAVASSRKAFEVSETQLRAGTVNLITVLQTQQTLLTNENNLVLIRLTKLLAASSLFQALGGGWNPNGQLSSLQPSPPQP